MKSFWMLLIKEFKASRLSFLAIAGSIAAWNIFLLFVRGSWDQDLILILSFLPLGVLPFFSLVSGVTSLSVEWHKQTIIVLRTLPLRGTIMIGVKLLVIFLMILLFTALVTTSSSLLGKGLIPPELTLSIRTLIVIAISISMLVFALVSQFAYVCSRMFNRLSTLIGIWVFLLTIWGLGRLSTLIVPLFTPLPHLSLHLTEMAGSESISIPTIEVNPGPLLAAAVGIVLLFFIESWLVEHHVEI